MSSNSFYTTTEANFKPTRCKRSTPALLIGVDTGALPWMLLAACHASVFGTLSVATRDVRISITLVVHVV